MRDLASAEVWQESLERSRARRSDGEARGRRDGGGRRGGDGGVQTTRAVSQRRLGEPRRKVARGRRLRLSLATLFLTGTLLMAAVSVSLAGAGGRTVAYKHRAHGDILVGSRQAPAPAGITAPETCQPAAGSSGYVNPLRQAKVMAERIDQGVDYAGTGKLLAIGSGRITYVGTTGTGWPGAFIEYRLQSGPDAGCYVYYAEGVQPPGWLHVGQQIHRGQGIAYIVPGWSTGIELGWGAGRSTRTYAQRTGRWTPVDDAEDLATGAGRSFSALIADLGGPAGKDEDPAGRRR